MMALTTMNPETRRLIQVTAAGIEETAAMFDMLLGMTSRDEKISLLNLAAIIWNWQISHKSEDKMARKKQTEKPKKYDTKRLYCRCRRCGRREDH